MRTPMRQMPAPPVSTNVGGLQTGGLDPNPFTGTHGGQVGLFPQPTPLPQYERSPSPIPPQGMGGQLGGGSQGLANGQGQGLATAPGQNRTLLPQQAQDRMQVPPQLLNAVAGRIGGPMQPPLQTGGLDPRPIPGPMPPSPMPTNPDWKYPTGGGTAPTSPGLQIPGMAGHDGINYTPIADMSYPTQTPTTAPGTWQQLTSPMPTNPEWNYPTGGGTDALYQRDPVGSWGR